MRTCIPIRQIIEHNSVFIIEICNMLKTEGQWNEFLIQDQFSFIYY